MGSSFSIPSGLTKLAKFFPLGAIWGPFLTTFLSMGILSTGPIITTWAYTVNCNDNDETCKKNRDNSKIAGPIIIAAFYIASAIGLWTLK